MVDTTANRAGQINAAGDVLALFLKVFAGEVLTQFEDSNVMKEIHMLRTISTGKSAQFPATGQASSDYHVPGENILDPTNSLLSTIGHNERVINIDELLQSSVFVPKLDEAMNHYDVRSIYATELGRALAKTFDEQVLRVGILAARATKTITSTGKDGGTVQAANAKTSGPDLAEAILDALQLLDEKDVPAEDRFAVVSPAQYYNLLGEPSTTKVSGQDTINRDFGGMGSIARGELLMLGGARIVKSNHIPSTNETGSQVAEMRNTYHADFTSTAALVFQKSAVGTVKLLDLAVEQEYLTQYQGTLLVAKYAMGHGILRPEAAVEIDIA